MEDNNYGIAIAIALGVVILFFGGWYLFFGQLFSRPDSPLPTSAPQITPSGLITDQAQQLQQ